jgi:hypothetical protein
MLIIRTKNSCSPIISCTVVMTDTSFHDSSNANARTPLFRYCYRAFFTERLCTFKVVGPPYTKLDHQRKEIRLIKINPNPGQDGEFSFDLITTTLNSRLKFTALSYTLQPEVPVEVKHPNNAERCATENGNLNVALEFLRDVNHCDLVWADAICIDQSNKEERSQQVAQMHTIYGTAHHVIGWLGFHPVFEPMVERVKEWAELGDYSEEHPQHFQKSGDGSDFCDNAGLDFLLSMKYWQRAWIFQEMATARRMTFAAGKRSFTYEELLSARRAWKHRALKRNFENHLNRQRQQTNEVTTRHWPPQHNPDIIRYYDSLTYNAAENMINLVERIRSTPKKDSLVHAKVISLHFFESFSHLLATDARDYIFALWGFVDHNSPNVELLEPNYNIDTATVFTNAARYFVKTTQVIRLLQCQSTRDTEMKLPAWVPNWGNGISGSTRSTRNYHMSHRRISSDNTLIQDPELAEMIKIVEYPTNPTGVSLEVTGAEYSTVVEVIGSNLFPFGLENLQGSLQNFMKHILSGPSVRDQTPLFHFIKLLDQLVLPSKDGHLVLIYLRLVSIPSHLSTRLLSTVGLVGSEPSSHWANLLAKSFYGFSSTQEKCDTLRNHLLSYVGKTVFRPDTGEIPEFQFFRLPNQSIGACHHSAEVQNGDVICRLATDPELFLLRKDNDSYKLLSDCVTVDMEVQNDLLGGRSFSF